MLKYSKIEINCDKRIQVTYIKKKKIFSINQKVCISPMMREFIKSIIIFMEKYSEKFITQFLALKNDLVSGQCYKKKKNVYHVFGT